MGIQENKATVERFDELTGAGELDALDDICTADMVNHALGAHRPPGLAGTKHFLAESERDPGNAAWRRSIIQDQQVITIAEGDYVIQFGRRSGTWPGGHFRGVDIRAGDYRYEVAFMYRLEDGRIAERWAVRDDLAMIQQLGVRITAEHPTAAPATRNSKYGRLKQGGISDTHHGGSNETPAPTTALDELRALASASLAAHLEAHVPRVSWDSERVQTHQRERLRALLAHALTHSPFHARRLAGINPAQFELADLPRLPVMSKAQMMAEFDELVTDRRVTRRQVEKHLAKSSVHPRLLLDRYVCLASGGSSGLRGIFVQTLDQYTQFVASVARPAIAAPSGPATLTASGVQIGLVGAGSPVHSSGFAAAILTGIPVRFVPAPATLPISEIVARLNTANPPALQGYPSLLRQLANERLVGRLRIAPRSVTSMGETLTAEDQDAITTGFEVPVTDMFVSTEGLVGHSQPGEHVLTFASDMCIVELVDERNQPVTPGAASAKLLLTNLHNLTQPLIRYELTDRFVAHPDAPENGHLRATVTGRADSILRYDNIEVSPFAIGSVFATAPSVREYQVVQTANGVEVAIVVDDELDVQTLADRLQATLRTAGIPNPEVTIRRVAAIDRHFETGKTRRFIPIATRPNRENVQA